MASRQESQHDLTWPLNTKQLTNLACGY